MWVFGSRSRDNLAECHPDLQALAARALLLSPLDFGIIDGGRTLEEQQEMKAAGKSRTLKSRHRFAWPLTPAGNRSRKYKEPVSHALDFMVYVAGRASWEFPVYQAVWDKAWKPAAEQLGIAVTWGGSWSSFRDGPHIQLSWKHYPAEYARDY